MQPKKDRIRFGCCSPVVVPKIDLPLEEQVRLVADGGIDFALVGWYDGFMSFDKEQRIEFFRLFDKHGVECLFYDEDTMFPFQGDKLNMMFDAEKLANADYYKDLPAFGGNMFLDEPGNVHFDEIGRTVREYMELFPGKLTLVNLLPMYANEKQLSGGQFSDVIDYYETQDISFQKYLDEFVEKVPTDYICVDIYPCHTDGKSKTTYKDYIRSIEIVADTCRREGREFWCCIQACGWGTSVRVPDEADFRWQVYTMLSYGVKTLIDYLYGSRCLGENVDPLLRLSTPIAGNGKKNPMWFHHRRVAGEVRTISDVYVQYRNLGAFSVNCTGETPYLRMANPYKGFDVLSDIQCDKPLLVGCFEKKNGKGSAFTLVNMTDLAKPDYAEVKVKIAGSATSYYGGLAKAEIADEAGYHTFTLGEGDGVFVTVE